MSVNFRLEPVAKELLKSHLEFDATELHKHSAKWLVANTKPGYPCRVSLIDAEVGERVLAITFLHHDVDSPYRASGPIFVREHSETARLKINEIPVMFHHRLLSLRAYSSDGFMIGAKTLKGTELERAIIDHFDNPEVEYQHIHNSSPGCFNCAVCRA